MALDIEKNLNKVKKQIDISTTKVGRSPQDVELIAVTKTVEPEIIEKAVQYGIRHVGENRVQELIRKYEILGNKVKWHMIGHLQKNKVKYIIDKVELIHSLDSYDLALEIDKRAKQQEKVMKCLLQVNVSREESKYGVDPKEVATLLEEINELNNIQIEGLMTIAPYTEEIEETRVYFRKLKELSIEISKMNFNSVNMNYLSMGMSNDFQVAIEEGGNLIRIGSKIFGERIY